MTTQRPLTLKEALRALDEAEAKLRNFEDDTRILRAKENASSSEARFRMLAEGVPNHLLFLDRDLRIEFANNVFLESAGWTAEAAHGKHISEVVSSIAFRSKRAERRRCCGRYNCRRVNGAGWSIARNQGRRSRFLEVAKKTKNPPRSGLRGGCVAAAPSSRESPLTSLRQPGWDR